MKFLGLIIFFTGVLRFADAQCVSAFPYVEGFEASNGNWTPGGVASDWAWGTPSKPVINAAGGGSKGWIIGGLSGSSYNNGERSYLQSPCFDFTLLVTPEIEFKVFWETERRFDGAAFQYSINNGASWNYLGVVNSNTGCDIQNWYNEPAVNFLSGNAGWSGNRQATSGGCLGGNGSNGWVVARHGLDVLAGQANVLFRFEFGAGTTCNNFDGFAIDDMVIRERPPAAATFTYTCKPALTVDFLSNANCALSVSWNFGDPASGASNTSAGNAPTHTFSAPGEYTVKLTAIFSGGVVTTELKQIIVLGASIAQTQFIQCSGDATAALSANASGIPGGYGYVWNTMPPQNTPTIQNVSAGLYTLVVSAANACAATATINVTEPPAIVLTTSATPGDCSGSNGSVSVTVTGGIQPYQYQWSTGATTGTVNQLPAGNYSVTVRDANNCIKTGAVTLTCGTPPPPPAPVTPVIPVAGVWFPNSFTPNADGLNDLFGPAGTNFSGVTNYVLTIYNRYGTIVFRSSDPYKKWNGAINGKIGGHEGFVYTAIYRLSNKDFETKGSVLRIR